MILELGLIVFRAPYWLFSGPRCFGLMLAVFHGWQGELGVCSTDVVLWDVALVSVGLLRFCVLFGYCV